MRKITTVLTVLALVALSSAALAKGDKDDGGGKARIAEQQWGMNFAIPTGNKTTFGLMYVLTDTMLLEADIGLTYINEAVNKGTDNAESSWGYMLAPGLRYYFMGSGPVNVYFKGALQFADNKDADAQLAVFAGLGVEWFVAKRFSISGDSGLAIQVMPTEDFGLGTLSHGLSANIYW